MNVQQPLSSLSMNKPVESPPVLPQTIINNQIHPPISTTHVPSRSSNKSFSNRLGMMIPPNQTQNSVVQEPKPIVSCHQYAPQKAKSPVIIKQSTILPNTKNQNQPRSNGILPPSAVKCKFVCFSSLISLFVF